MLDIIEVNRRVEAMERSCVMRDREMNDIRQIRAGHIATLYPDLFTDEIPGNIAGNIIDVAARDTAELIAPLPALACTSGNMDNASDERRAGKKNKVGSYYWEKSHLSVQNIRYADSVNSYSHGAYRVEPDFEHQCPRIRWLPPWGIYYYKDRFGQMVWFCQVARISCLTLRSSYPDLQHRFMRDEFGTVRSDDHELRLVTYDDRQQSVVYLPDCGNLVLAQAANPLKRVPVAVAQRPDQETNPRGQYDDVKWPALAKARMAQYMLQAADKSINAPLALPDDVTQFAYGADAVFRSASPEKVRRVSLDIPQDVFVLAHELDSAAKQGARYPEARTGGIQGNIITGRGVQELMGTMDTQVRTMQTIIGAALEEATSLCFEMDAALWPNTKKTITGVLTGKPFELTYVPSKDIGTNYNCKVTYGFAAGLSPSQAIVALLQLRGDDLISRDTLRRQLPFDVDPEEEKRAIDVQGMEDAAKQGLMGLAQALGPLVSQGQDPIPVLMAIAKTIEQRQRGKPVHESLLLAFAKPKGAEVVEEEGTPVPGEPPQVPNEPPGEMPPGMRPGGLMQGVPYGQQGMPPGGMPAVSALLASLRGQGSPRLEASIIRKRAVGAG
jgi:hypothetical protein